MKRIIIFGHSNLRSVILITHRWSPGWFPVDKKLSILFSRQKHNCKTRSSTSFLEFVYCLHFFAGHRPFSIGPMCAEYSKKWPARFADDFFDFSADDFSGSVACHPRCSFFCGMGLVLFLFHKISTLSTWWILAGRPHSLQSFSRLSNGNLVLAFALTLNILQCLPFSSSWFVGPELSNSLVAGICGVSLLPSSSLLERDDGNSGKRRNFF